MRVDTDATTTPLLSVVCICFQNPEELRATLASCAGLPADDCEIVVIDGSPDDSCEAIVDAAATPVHRYVHEPDKGVFDAMNKGVAQARGDGVLMLNSGDLLVDAAGFGRALAAVRDKLKSHVLFGDTVDRLGTERVPRPAIREVTPDQVRTGDLPSHQSVILPRQFCRANPYDLSLVNSADTACVREAFRTLPSLKLDLVIAEFTFGGRSNAAPRVSDILPQYRGLVKARDLSVAERLAIGVRLIARSLIGSLLGKEGHLKLQARRARKRHRQSPQ